VTVQRRTWAETLKEAAQIGLMLNILALPAAFGVLAATDHWHLAFLAIPASVGLCVVIAVMARLIGSIRPPRDFYREPRPPGRARVILTRTAAVVGLLAAVAAGIALMGVGIQIATDSPVCDPEVSRCVLVVDGVTRGETNTSVESQQTSNFLTGMIAFFPGLCLLVATYFGVKSLARSITAPRARA
jgi:hypothetical protein